MNTKALRERHKELTACLVESKKERQRVLDLYESGRRYQGEGELKAREAELDKQETKWKKELDTVCSRMLSKEQQRDRLAAAKRVAKVYREALRHKDLPSKKREIIQELVKQIVIFPNRVRVIFKIRKNSDGGGDGGIGGGTPEIQQPPYGAPDCTKLEPW
jgi:hypothetical protein